MSLTFRQSGIVAAIALSAALATGPARAVIVVGGSDYLTTTQPTFFTPLGALNPLAGLAIGPGNTDTIVQRQRDCGLDLLTLGSSCRIPIELLALSLVSTVDPNVLLRESPTRASTGTMTMISDGTGTGGTFNSFFDVFFEISFNGGADWTLPDVITLDSSGTHWLAEDPTDPDVIVTGLVGNLSANLHTNKSTDQSDFRIVGTVTEQHPGVGVHSAQTAQQVPEPGSLALVGLALAAASALRRARADGRQAS